MNFHTISNQNIQKIIQNYKIVELICFYVGIDYFPNLLFNRAMVRNILQNHDFGRKTLLYAYNCLHFRDSPFDKEDENLSIIFDSKSLLILIRRIVSWPRSIMNDSRMEDYADSHDNSLRMIDWTHIIPIEKYIFLGNYHFPSVASSTSFAWPDGTISTSSAPFTRYIKDRSENSIRILLSCIAYFELCYKPSEANGHHMNDHVYDDNYHHSHKDSFAIGLATSITPLRLEEVLSVGAWNSVAYHCDGRCFQSGQVIKGVEGPKYDVGDIIGCGLIYPPLGHAYGQIIFTKNGDIALTLNLEFNGFYTLPWFPVMYISSLNICVDFNFGLSESFSFDMIEYECHLLSSTKSINADDAQSFYKLVVLSQEKINKPMLHPALRDRDPALQRDGFSTAATMSDCSDQMDNTSNKSNASDHHHCMMLPGNVSSTDQHDDDISRNKNKRRKHHDHDDDDDDMEGDVDWNNELDNMSSASQHHHRHHHSEALPHKRRLFPVAEVTDKRSIQAYHHASSNIVNNHHITSSSSCPYNNSTSLLAGLDDIDTSSYSRQPHDHDHQRRSLRFHDESSHPAMISYSKNFTSSLPYGFNHRDDNDMDDNMSVATSMLVEVASVDEDGIYVSYGGHSDDDDMPEREDSLRLGGSSPDLSANASHTMSERYMHIYSPSTALLPSSMHTSSSISSHGGGYAFGSEDATTSRLRSASSSVSSYSIADEVQNMASNSAYTDDWSMYGYDGGSERCRRDDESDYEGDDLGTVGEDINIEAADEGSVAATYGDHERVIPSHHHKHRNHHMSDETSSLPHTIKKRGKTTSLPIGAINKIHSGTSSPGQLIHVGVRYPSENCYPSFGEHPPSIISPLLSPGFGSSTMLIPPLLFPTQQSGTVSPVMSQLSMSQPHSESRSSRNKLHYQHKFYHTRKRERRKSSNP